MERVVRTALLTLLIVGFAAAYLWDGYVGYPRKNARELMQLLGLGGQAAPPIDPGLTADRARQVAAEVRAGEPVFAVISKLGEPQLRHGDDAYYLGRGGWLKVAAEGGRVAAISWTDGGKTESDQRWQRRLGFALCVAGLLAALQFARVVGARLVLGDGGLQVSRRTPIPLDAITAMRPDSLSRGRVVEIEYKSAGRPALLRLDPYAYRNLEPIVAELRERKAFPKPT